MSEHRGVPASEGSTSDHRQRVHTVKADVKSRNAGESFVCTIFRSDSQGSGCPVYLLVGRTV